MAKQRRAKKRKGSSLLTIIVILFVLGAIGSGGEKKSNKSSIHTTGIGKETALSGNDRGVSAIAKKESSADPGTTEKTITVDAESETTNTAALAYKEIVVSEDEEVQKKKENAAVTSVSSRRITQTKTVASSEPTTDAEQETVPATEETYQQIQRGDSGDSVVEVQTKLFALGFLTSSADGKFGPGTEQAVKDFQTSYQIEPSGIVDKDTYDAMFAAVSDEKETEQTSFASVKRGDSGDAVVTVQNRLISLGYLTSSADGKFGPGTESAVAAFQSANNLVASGIVDESTYNRMFSSGAKRYVAPILELDAANDASDVGTRNTTEPLVWIPTNGGKKYHSYSGCSGMKDPIQVPLSEAQARGFTPCKKC